MLNPFFLQGSKSEQSLIQDLINEQLRMYGVEVYYIPRKYVTKNTIIKEVIESKFDNAYPIEAYVDTYDGYEGQGTILSKFGVQPLNDLNLIISKERFETYISPLIKNLPNVELSTRPKEGDLIYFPLGDRIFEIKFVEHEKPFYQLQKTYVYELRCELFRYEDEIIDTGVEDIDDNVDDKGYIQSLTMVGTAITATAVSSIFDGGVRFITLTNRGNGYKSAPRVAISSAPASGLTAVGIATLIGGLVDCNGNIENYKVQGVEIINPGYGYTVTPSVVFVGGGGSGASATATLGNGIVGMITITSSGSGYETTPTVTFSTPKHVGAAATAIIDYPIVGGGVSVISAPISIGASSYLFPGGTTGGVFYKSAPTVTFSAPTGTGNNAQATAILDSIAETGGTVETIAITTGGKFYTSAPSVSITHPGFSFASATIGIAGSSINPGSIAFSTTGRAYRTAPTVSISTSFGQSAPTIVAVGIATIDSITGIVTAVSFNQTDPWSVGTGATIGAGYTASPVISFSGSPSPVQATATATISIAGVVDNISIGNSGFGYATTPIVSIESPAGGNEQFRATGIATIRFNSIETIGTVGIGSTCIVGVNTTNIIVGDRIRLAFGYDDLSNFIPTDTYVTSIGSSELFINNSTTNVGIATTTLEFGIDQCGIVTGITITYGGGGYLEPPSVTISNEVSEKNYIDIISGVATATGRSLINSAGIVTSIHITDSGSNYILPPTVTISSPYSSGSGEYIYNETVTGSISSTTAVVKSWDSSTNTLNISNISGTFVNGDIVVGSESGASYKVRIVTTDDTNDPYAQNDEIELEADSIIDFSELNPFGNP